MNRFLRSQFPPDSRNLAVFDTTAGSSPGRTRWSNSLNRWVAAIAIMLFAVMGSKAQVTTVFSQNFDGAWTIPSSLSPAWSSIGTGDQQWHMNTYTTGWTSTSGAYSPTGAASTTQSARWHSYDAASGTSGSLITPSIDLSANTSLQRFVGFSYINTSGTDVLKVYVSTDGGTTYGSALTTLGTASAWTSYAINLGASAITSTVVIKLEATGDFGTTDIGVDQLSVFTLDTSIPFTANANGGLWSSPATWVGGIVPPAGNVSIPSGTTVIVDQVVSIGNLDVSGILEWNATANAMTLSGNLTVNSGGSLLPYTTAGTTGVNLNIAGNLTNNGYINMAAGSGTPGIINFNGSGSTISGTGVFQGDGTNGIIRVLQFANTGSNVINTAQNLVVYDLRLDGGTLNTNGKVIVDNTPMVYNLAFNTGVASVNLTTMGVGYTAAPMIGPTGSARWAASTAFTANQVKVWGGNVYVVTVAGTSGTTGPSHTSGTATDGTATLLWVGSSGSLGAAYMSVASHVLGTFYFYGNNLYICTTAGAGASATPPTHTSGTVVCGVAAFKYVGTAAKATPVWDSSTNTVRAINVSQAGSGYLNTAAPVMVIVADQTAAVTTAAAATVVVFQSIAGPTNSVARRSPGTTITGGLTINSNSTASTLSSNNPQALSGVDMLYTTNGGNYNNTTAPAVGFTLPNNLNLITSGGSGCTTTPTVTVTGTTVAGTALTNTAFTLTWSNGSVVSLYCSAPGTTAFYAVPPTITITGCTVNPTVAWPANCLPTATANLNANGMIQSFTITNRGYGYNSAPTAGYGTVTPGATATASAPTVRLGLYNYTIAVNTPTTTASTPVTEDAFVPSNRIINTLTLGTSAAGFNLSGGDLTLIGSSPLSLTASSNGNGNVLNLGGYNLIYPWNQYAGVTGTYNNGGTKAYVKNGGVIMYGRGGNTWDFPFAGNAATASVRIFTGAVNAATNTTNILTAKISDLGAPTNATTGGTGWAMGNRSFKINTTTFGGGVGTAGTTATMRLPWNDLDGLTTAQNMTFLAEAPSTSGAWTIKSAAVGASGALAAIGSLTSTTTAPGPVTLADGNVYAFAGLVPTVTDITPLTMCANSTAFTITGTNLTGVTSVKIGGVNVGSFTVVSATSITGFAGAATSGVVTVTNSINAVGTGTQTATVNASPNAPTVSTAAQTISLGDAANVTASGNGGTFVWYTQANGGTSVLTGATLNLVPCATTTYYVAESDGTCEGTRTAVVITVTNPSITSDLTSVCGNGGGTANLTANGVSSNATSATWSSLTSGATLSGTTGSTNVATIGTSIAAPGAANFQLAVTYATCTAFNAYYSVGVYPLPSATVTTTASGVCPGTSATIGSGLSAGNFSVTSIPFVAQTPPASAGVIMNNGTAVLPLSGGTMDDGGWSGIPIGFNFNFFGNSFSTLSCGTNGLLMFGTPPGYGTGAGQLGQYNFTGPTYFPNAANPGNIIALMAADGHAGNSTAGSIKYWTEGYAPNRVFNLKYTNYYFYLSNPQYTASVKLYETTGIVEVYIDSKTYSNTAIVGLQDATKTIGAVAPNRPTNPTTGVSTAWTVATGEAWRFTPPANYMVIWSANGIPFASGVNSFSQTVAPSVTTNYSILYANQTTQCSNATSPASVTMVVLPNTAPTGVTATSSSATVCSGVAFTLNTDYTGITDGLTYQWQVSTDNGGTWNNITGATTMSYSASQTVASQYRLQMVSCSGTPGYSAAVSVAMADFQNCYCTAMPSSTADEEIYSFTLNGTSTPSAYAGSNGCTTAAPGAGSVLSRYSNFTSIGTFVNLVMGESNSITVQEDECDGATYYSNGFAAFIDYNHDGDFLDAGEMVYNDGTATLQSPRVINGTFTVPNTAMAGVTRMRIIVAEGVTGSSITPCMTWSFGETEDYLVNILGPCDNTVLAPFALAGDDSMCGAQTTTVSAFDLAGAASPTFAWYTASTGGTLLGSGANYTTSPITGATSIWVQENTGTCITARTEVPFTWAAAPALTMSAPTASCGTAQTTTVSVSSSNTGYTYTWSVFPLVGSGITGNPQTSSLSVTPVSNGNYTFTVNAADAITGCVTSGTTSVGYYVAPTGTATVTQPTSCGGNGSVNFNVSGSGTVFSNDFTSSTLDPAQASLCNNATITGGRLQFTAPVNNQKGGILINNTTGLASNDFQIDFDMITTAGSSTPADGFSYSYGPDVVCMPSGTTGDNLIVGAGAANPENGSGSGIRLSFDAYTNGVNVNGIYLMYNCLRVNPSSALTAADGLYYYANNTSWIGGATTHVTVKINNAGQMSLWLNSVQVLNNAQLPASYLSADKSTWKHAFCARTGGLNQGHLIDNLDIHYNNFYEYSVDNGATWTTNSPVSVASPASVHSIARYVTAPECSIDLGTASIDYVVAPPTSVTGGSSCLNGTVLNVSGNGPALAGTLTATSNIATSQTLAGSGTLTLSGTVSIPAGAIVSSAVLRFSGVSTTGATFPTDITVSMTGASSVSSQVMANVNATVTNQTYDLTASIPSVGGAVTVNLTNGWTGPATISSVDVVLTYTLPSAPSWFSSSTPSSGNLLGTGSPFNVVGTAALPSTASVYTGTVYAATMVVNGASTCYSTSVPATISVGTPLAATISATTSYTSSTALNVGTVSLPGSGSVTVSGNVSLPAGAVVTGTQVVVNGVTTTGATFVSDISVSVSGAATMGSTVLGSGTTVTNAGPYTLNTSNLASAGGTVYVTFSNGWTSPATFTSVAVVVNYIAPVTSSVCPGSPLNLSVSTTGGGGNQAYQWNLNGTPIVSANSSTYSATPNTGDVFTVTVSDACNPLGVLSSTYSPTLFAVAAGSITGPAAINVNDFTATPPSGGTYVLAGQTTGSTIQWSYSSTGVAPWTAIGGATNSSQQLFASGAAGTLYVTTDITTPDGCTAQASPVMITMGNAIDSPCTAYALTLGNQTGLSFSTAAATVDAGEVAPPNTGCSVQTGWCNSTLNGTVWFSFVAPASGHVSILAGGWDNQMAIYSATNCADYSTFTLINANDDGSGPGAATTLGAYLSDVKCLTPGATYYIQLDGYSGVGATTMIVTDLGNAAPTITGMPTNMTVNVAAGTCGATATWTAPTIADAQGCFTSSSNYSPGATFPVGTTTVTYTATDVQGLVATASFTVTVVDNINPTITAPAAVSVTAAMNSCTATATLGTPVTADNCTVASVTNNAPATFPIGNTNVIWTVTDAAGNTATATQVVTVVVNPGNIWYLDADGDGYGTTAGTTTACSLPAGYSANTTDCNDANAAVNPGHFEVCGNLIDDNCNGQTDEGCQFPGENPSNAISSATSFWPNCSTINGTLAGATVSSAAQTTCLTGEDKWYQFVATSEGVNIVVNSTSNDIVLELQTAAGALVAQENSVAGIGGEIMTVGGLTAGQLYKLGIRNYNSALGIGTYSACVQMLKRGGCDYGPGPYSLCQYFKATWAGSAGTSYRYTFTGLTGPAAGNVYTRTQSTDICVLSNVTPTLPYGSTYSLLITNIFTINNGAGVAETIEVPALAPCTVTTVAEAATSLRTTDQCSAGPRFRGAVVAALPWSCGASNWRWRFTEVNPTTYATVGLPFEVNRGAASNYINLGTVAQLQYGKTYAVQSAPIFTYTGSNYNWGPTTYMCIVGTAGMVVDNGGSNEEVVRNAGVANGVNLGLYPNPTHGENVNISLSGVKSDNVQIRIVDAMGRQVYSNRFAVDGILNTNLTFQHPLANGLYMVEAIFNGEVHTQRMMVQK